MRPSKLLAIKIGKNFTTDADIKSFLGLFFLVEEDKNEIA